MKNGMSVMGGVVSIFVLLSNCLQARILLQQEDCSDVAPDDQYSCQQQLEWGKCQEGWLMQGQYCQKTCGRCTKSQQDNLNTPQPSDQPPKQCRLNNCTIIEYYGENPFIGQGRSSGRKLQQLEAARAGTFSHLFQFQHHFQVVEEYQLPTTYYYAAQVYDGSYLLPSVTFQDKSSSVSIIIKEDEEKTNEDQSIFFSKDITDFEDSKMNKSERIPIPSPSPSPSPSSPSFSPSPQPTPSPLPEPSPIFSPIPTPNPTSVPTSSPSPSPQGGVVAFSLEYTQQDSGGGESGEEVYLPGLYQLYGDSAVLDPGSSAATVQQNAALLDVARTAVARLELDRLQEECLDNVKAVLVEPCCEQYVINQGEDICDVASAAGIDCQQLKDLNDVTSVAAGQIIQVC